MTRKKRIPLYDRTPENDIRYRGPLSYRFTRLIGWICMALAQFAAVLGLAVISCQSSHPNTAASFSVWEQVLSIIGSGAVPLFLLANFALILQSRERIARLVLIHLAGAIGIGLAFVLVYRRYLYGYIHYFLRDSAEGVTEALVQTILSKHLNFNVFVDLLMCSSTYFFMVYRPRKCFRGKKLVVFRLFVLIPALYEIACCVLTGLANGLGLFSIPLILSPLFTTKPFLTYIAFFIIIVFVRSRKKRYMSHGKSEEDYKEFLKTNANSLSVSLFIAGVFLIAGVIDLISSLAGTAIYTALYKDPTLTTQEIATDYAAPFVQSWGIGKSIDLFLGVPIVLLLSYTRKHSPNTKFMDIVLPLSGIVLCILVYLEGGLMILQVLQS